MVIDNESTCFYLLEAVKAGAKVRFEKVGLSAMLETITAFVPLISEKWARVRRQLRRSASTGSRM